MPDKNLTDKEIVKALDNIYNRKWVFAKTDNGDFITIGDVNDLINRLQGENERKDKRLKEVLKGIENIKEQAYKECIEKVKEEIAEALKSNYKAKAEREQKIPIYTENEFLSYCSGKIDCLRGLDDFLDNLLKEMVDNNG